MIKNRNQMILTFAIMVMAFLPQMIHAAAPKLTNYQGSLYDANGAPLATGDYTLSFSIYNGSEPTTSATPVWGPQVFDGSTVAGHGLLVPVVNGYFNVILGPIDTASRSLDSAFDINGTNNRFIEVSVNGGAPILPRQQVLSTPYAITAQNAQTSLDSVPVGTILPFFGDVTSLSGLWKVADGSILADASSPYNGIALPDLRGRFLRGSNAVNSVGTTGGANTHRHSVSNGYDASTNTTTGIQVWMPAYLKSATDAYSGSNDQQSNVIEVIEQPWAGYNLFDSLSKGNSTHGHVNGRITGNTASSTTVPEFYTVVYIIRIK